MIECIDELIDENSNRIESTRIDKAGGFSINDAIKTLSKHY